MDINYIWEEATNKLRDELTEISFKTWIESAKPVSCENGSFTVSVPDKIHKDTLENKFKFLLENALVLVTGENYTLLIETSVPEFNPAIRSMPVSGDQIQATNLNPKYTFSSFVIGENNRFAHAAALAVAENPGLSYNPLFIYSNAGLGKTHLMHAIGNYIKENRPTSKILYVSSEKFTNDVINALGNTAFAELRNKYRSIDVLLIDDIQFLAGKDRTQEEFFHTFNVLYEANKQIIMTSDRPPKEISPLEERLRSRFECGMLADMQPPDYETRLAILKKKSEQDHIELPENILALTAEKIKSNIRELEGAIKRIYLYQSLTNKNISEELANEALKDFIKKDSYTPISSKQILEEVSRFFDISIDDLKSNRRTKELSYARQIAMYLCRNLTEDSLKSIADVFGKKDHTTIIYACGKIDEQMKEDITLKNSIQELTKNLKSM